jgi:hypothetical protein
MLRWIAVVAVAAVASPALAQNVQRPGPLVGCPLRDVKATIEKISPQGEMVLDVKGELMVAKLTDQTRYVIPGYDKKELHKGVAIRLPAKTQARLRICLTNGEVEHMKVLSQPKKDE